MKQKRAEFLKLKALQSYQEAKFKRLKHIKSKRYRKILRLEREKNEEKNLAKMEKDDPAQFKEVLKELEKKRMMERMSLKHKNTSKWSKQQALYAKYNDKARDQVQEQLEISKKLTQRVKEFEYDDSDVEKDDKKTNDDSSSNVNLVLKDGLLVNNPWIKMMSGVGGLGVDKSNEKEENIDKEDYSKPKAFLNKREIENAQNELEDESDDDDVEIDQIDKSEVKNLAKTFTNESDDDEEIVHVKEQSIVVQNNAEEEIKTPVEELNTKEPHESNDLVEKNLKPVVKNISLENKSKLEVVNKKKANEQEHFMSLNDAFADDDVIEEFRLEKVIKQTELE